MSIQPMRTKRLGPIIERHYRETSRFQWAREVAKNALEAGATRIDFGIEWQGVESHHVYRRLIADNGCGMSADQLEEFFNEFGGGGKPIGSEHENFGIGAKTTLLPWNKLGVVVVSWQDDIANMIRIRRREEDGEYGLETYQVQDDDGMADLESVVEPFFDEELGIDWAKIKPDWIEDHGTVIVLLGNAAEDDTVRGDPDPDRNEDGIRTLAQYLNNRFWRPEAKINFLELATTIKEQWPTCFEARGGFEKGFFNRPIYGAEYYIATASTFKNVSLKSGTMEVPNALVHWYLWEAPEKPYRDNRMPRMGGVCVLYDNELYDWTTGLTSIMRAFGICEKIVADNLWIVIRPPGHGLHKRGVYPRADRSKLLWSGGKELPFDDWATKFADNLPQDIITALMRARKDEPSTIDDIDWLNKLAQRFAGRLSLPRYKSQNDSDMDGGLNNVSSIRPDKDNATPGTTKRSPVYKPRLRKPKTEFSGSGDEQGAKKTHVKLGFPNCEFTNDQIDVDDSLAVSWTPPNKSNPTGLIKIWRMHPAMTQITGWFKKDYSGYAEEKVRAIVEGVIKESMIVRVAHSEGMVSKMGRRAVDALRDPRCLTMALLGGRAEDTLIRQRLSANVGKKRRPTEINDEKAAA